MNIEQLTEEPLKAREGISAISLEEFEQHMADQQSQAELTGPDNLFVIREAYNWLEIAQKRPIPKKLFGDLWFETELCILFADTNLGKSILAVQIGDSISRGVPINGFEMEAEKQAVLYFDFELTDKQFENRYSQNFMNHYGFDRNFKRAEIDPNALAGNMPFEEYLHQSLEQSIIRTKAKVLIIDNITYLKNETEKAKDALPLMKHLKALKTKYGLLSSHLPIPPKGIYQNR